MENTHLYKDGHIINYEEGDRSLQRYKLEHTEDIEDKAYTIRQEDTIDAIAFKFYGNPFMWYIIADINDIDNPLQLVVGEDLIIPNINRYDL